MMISAKEKKAFTLIEFVMVISAVSVMAVGAVVFFIPLTNLFFVSPRQAAVEFMGQEILDLIIDGNTQVKGLRFLKAISSASATQIDYTDADDKTVSIRWDQPSLKFYRNINSAGEVSLPLYCTASTKIQGKAAADIIFSFFDTAGAEIASPVDAGSLNLIKRAKIDITVYTGSGAIKDFQGRVNLTAGVDIKTFS